MMDLKTLDAEIRCKHNYQRFLDADTNDLTRAAIWEIRKRNQEAGLSKRSPRGDKSLVSGSLDLLNRAMSIDPENARRYARVLVADYTSMADCERKRLESKGITRETYAKELEEWTARKKSFEKSGFWYGLTVTSKPEPFYYAESYERWAQDIRKKHNL